MPRNTGPAMTRVATLAVLVTLIAGCGDPPEVAPVHNRTFVTLDGQFVGHLKPVPPPVGPGGKPVKPVYPVVWVVDGAAVERTELAYDISTFRLDFNEKEPLTEAILPFALMTESSREVIIHRGPPPAVFTNADIHDGERAYAVVHCDNRDCPRRRETDNGQLFTAAPETAPVCPSCGQSHASEFITPQHREMREFMARPPKR